ncbi:MAG: TPM domain-containing protein [Paracoccus sp. (in: a-proteobacteria)]
MIRVLFIWLMLALPVRAQSLPDWQYTSVNDFAGILNNDDTRILDQALISLHDDTGMEGTVITLTNRARYGGMSGLEPFATRLFNYWGIGEARRNDGFMILLLRDDREVRVELGTGYPAIYDQVSEQIIENSILPFFRADDYSQGLRQGTLEIIEQIARPHANGAAPSGPQVPAMRQDRKSVSSLVFFLLMGSLPAIFIFLKRRAKRCPQCHGNRFHTERTPVRDDSSGGGWSISNDRVMRVCRNCGWRDNERTILRHQTTTYDRNGLIIGTTENYRTRNSMGWKRGSDGFGGGSSSGGGASGRW